MGRDSFVLHTSYLDQLDLLEDAEAGILFRAILLYAAGQELPEMDRTVQMAFSLIRRRMDEEWEKYDKKVQARREAGKLGGRPKKAEPEKPKEVNVLPENAKKANGFFDKQNNPDTVPDTVPVTDNNKKNIMCDAAALFERLWKLYPNKKGKGQVSDTQKKRLLAVGETALVKAIERYSTELQQDADWRKPQNGSTFFNSGYVDYLDGNYTPAKESGPQRVKGTNRFNNFEQRQYDESFYDKLAFGGDKK